VNADRLKSDHCLGLVLFASVAALIGLNDKERELAHKNPVPLISKVFLLE